MSIDWGYVHATAVYWHTQAGETGEGKKLIVTFREYVTDHLSERALAEQIVSANQNAKIQSIYGGHDLWNEKQDGSGESKERAMSKVFNAAGLPSLRKATIDRIDGWRFMHRALDEGEWIITENCKEAIRAIPSAIFDDKHPGHEEDILKTRTKYDDVLDSLRYGVYSQYAPGKEPDNIRMMKQVAHITDITSRNIMLTKLNTDIFRARANAGNARCHAVGRFRRYARR
jgi:hypothetical protein